MAHNFVDVLFKMYIKFVIIKFVIIKYVIIEYVITEFDCISKSFFFLFDNFSVEGSINLEK